MESLQFMELDIRPEILKAIANMGFEEMTPIQAKAIPVELTGADVVGLDEGTEATEGGDVCEQKRRGKGGVHRVADDGAEDDPVELAADAREA